MNKRLRIFLILLFDVFLILLSSNIAYFIRLEKLDVNNIKARFQSAGLLFSDPYTSNPSYQVSASNQHTIYAGNLWIGGLDGNGQLHLAGETYSIGGQWGDFYPGPVSNASVYATSHFDWNYVWTVLDVVWTNPLVFPRAYNEFGVGVVSHSYYCFAGIYIYDADHSLH